MLKADYHIHSIYSDGRNTPEEMVEAAIRRGFELIGFTDHSYTAFDDFGMTDEKAPEYKAEVLRLREKYKGIIDIRLGIEMDYYSDNDTSGYDYIIGSIHSIKVGDEQIAVDWNIESFKEFTKEKLDNNYISVASVYYEKVAEIVEKTGADIIGHLDLISLFNRQEGLFDPKDPEYRALWQKAVDTLIPYNRPFEINTAPIHKGLGDEAYPGNEIIEYIKEKGGRFVFSSDSHSTETIGCAFENFEHLLGDNTL